jgi:hemerythrin-like domain-containing protein
MIYYIDAFPERFHHPKEDEYLFRLLRLRHPEAAPLLDRLKMEHRAGAEKIRTLEQTLARYQQGGAAEFPNFLAAVEAYAAFHWDHMRTEEKRSCVARNTMAHGSERYRRGLSPVTPTRSSVR